MAEANGNELVQLTTLEGKVEGEVALRLDPGTSAEARKKALDEVLANHLTEAASAMNLVLDARPSAFALEQPGRDELGRTHYRIRGRREGDRLVPALREPKPARGRGPSRRHR